MGSSMRELRQTHAQHNTNRRFVMSRMLKIVIGLMLVSVIATFALSSSVMYSQEIPEGENDVYLPSVTSAKEAEAQPSPTSVVEEGWLFHEDRDRGFGFKYPANWYLTYHKMIGKSGSQDMYTKTILSDYDPSPESRDWKTFVLSKEHMKIQIGWYINSSITPIESSSLRSSLAQKETEVRSLEERMYGEHSAIHTTTEDMTPYGQARNYGMNTILIPHGDRVLSIIAMPEKSDHIPVLEEIAASVEFYD